MTLYYASGDTPVEARCELVDDGAWVPPSDLFAAYASGSEPLNVRSDLRRGPADRYLSLGDRWLLVTLGAWKEWFVTLPAP